MRIKERKSTKDSKKKHLKCKQLLLKDQENHLLESKVIQIYENFQMNNLWQSDTNRKNHPNK